LGFARLVRTPPKIEREDSVLKEMAALQDEDRIAYGTAE
jgi:hypothetical protein